MDEYQLEQLVVSLTGDAAQYMQMLTQAQQSTEQVSKQVEESAKGIEGFGKALLNFGGYISNALMSLGLGAKLLGTVQDYEGQESANRRVKAALAAAGQEIDRNFQKLSRFSEDLQRVSVYADEGTLALTAQAVAMGLNADAARRAVENATALAAVYHSEPGAFLRLTTMLEQGFVERLQRFIPVLRGIKDPAEKSKRAYEELHKMFKLVLEDAKTYTGQTKQLANAWGDFKEIIGKTVVVYLTPLLELKRKIVSAMGGISDGLKFALVTVGMLGVALLALGPALALLRPLGLLIMAPLAHAGLEMLHFLHLSTVLNAIWIPIWFVIKSVGFLLLTMLSPIKLLVTGSFILVGLWNAMWSPMGIAFFTILKIVAVIAIVIRQAGSLEQLWKNIVQGAKDLWKWLAPVGQALGNLGSAALERVLVILDEVGKEMMGMVKSMLAIDTFDWSGFFTSVRTHVVGALNFLAYAMRNLGSVWEAVMEAFKAEWNSVMDIIGPVLEFIEKRILDVISAIYEWLKSNLGLIAGMGAAAVGVFILIDAILLAIVVVKSFVAVALLVNWLLGVLGVKWVLAQAALLGWYVILGLGYGLLKLYTVTLWAVNAAMTAVHGVFLAFGVAVTFVRSVFIVTVAIVALAKFAWLTFSAAVAVARGTMTIAAAAQAVLNGLMTGYTATTYLGTIATTVHSAAMAVATTVSQAYAAILMVLEGATGGVATATSVANAALLGWIAAASIAETVTAAWGTIVATVKAMMTDWAIVIALGKAAWAAWGVVLAGVYIIQTLVLAGMATGAAVLAALSAGVDLAISVWTALGAIWGALYATGELIVIMILAITGAIQTAGLGVMLANAGYAILDGLWLGLRVAGVGLEVVLGALNTAWTAFYAGILMATGAITSFEASAAIVTAAIESLNLVITAARMVGIAWASFWASLRVLMHTDVLAMAIGRAVIASVNAVIATGTILVRAWGVVWNAIKAPITTAIALIEILKSAGRGLLAVGTFLETSLKALKTALLGTAAAETAVTAATATTTAAATAGSTAFASLGAVFSSLVSGGIALTAVIATLGAALAGLYSAAMGVWAALGAVGTLFMTGFWAAVWDAGEKALARGEVILRNAATKFANKGRQFLGMALAPLEDIPPLSGWEHVIAMFGEWWELLKRIWGVIKAGDYTLAWRLFVAGAQLAFAQVSELWPGLWNILAESAKSTWDVITVYFTTEFYKAFAGIAIKIRGLLGSIIPEGLIGFLERSSSRYDQATARMLRSLKGPQLDEESKRIAEEAANLQQQTMATAKAKVEMAIKNFNPGDMDSEKIRQLRDALGGIVAEADKVIQKFEDQMNPKAYELGKGMGEQIKKGLGESLKTMDAVLIRSAEAAWRHIEYRQRLNLGPFKGPEALKGLHGAAPNAPEALENAVAKGNVKGNRIAGEMRDILARIEKKPQPNIGMAGLA